MLQLLPEVCAGLRVNKYTLHQSASLLKAVSAPKSCAGIQVIYSFHQSMLHVAATVAISLCRDEINTNTLENCTLHVDQDL